MLNLYKLKQAEIKSFCESANGKNVLKVKICTYVGWGVRKSKS